MAKAIATSLFVISLISTSGFVSHLVYTGFESYSTLFWVITGSLSGMFISQLLAPKVSGPRLQKIFSILLGLIACVALSRLY